MIMDEELLKQQIQNALNKAYFYLKFRPRSEKEVSDYLQKKAEKFGWSSVVVEGAVSALKELNFINDKDFIEWFVEQRNHSKQKSRFALEGELGRFGIDRDLIKNYFEESPLQENELALKALRRRWPRFQYLDKKIRFQKAASFLAQRGFSFGVIKESIRKLEEE